MLRFLIFLLWRANASGLVKFRHINYLLGIRKRGYFGLNYSVLSAQRGPENVLMVAKITQFCHSGTVVTTRVCPPPPDEKVSYMCMCALARCVQKFAHYYNITLHKISVKTPLLTVQMEDEVMRVINFPGCKILFHCTISHHAVFRHPDITHGSISTFLRSYCILSLVLGTYTQAHAWGFNAVLFLVWIPSYYASQWCLSLSLFQCEHTTVKTCLEFIYSTALRRRAGVGEICSCHWGWWVKSHLVKWLYFCFHTFI